LVNNSKQQQTLAVVYIYIYVSIYVSFFVNRAVLPATYVLPKKEEKLDIFSKIERKLGTVINIHWYIQQVLESSKDFVESIVGRAGGVMSSDGLSLGPKKWCGERARLHEKKERKTRCHSSNQKDTKVSWGRIML
jgi:hypothetical protein